MSSMDMSQYLDIFLDEGRESLAVLETNFLSMENGDHSKEMLATIFRAAHTLKGSSRAMGFLTIGNLTHEMENVLDDLRNDKLVVSTSIMNALLECLDTLQTMIEGVATSGNDSETGGKDVDGLIKLLADLRNDMSVSATPIANPGTQRVAPRAAFSSSLSITEYELTSINDAVSNGEHIYLVKIEIHPECVMKSVRAFMVLGAINQIGSVLTSNPKEDSLDAEEFDLSFELLVATAKSAIDLEAPLRTISELTGILVTPWTGEGSVESTATGEFPIEPYELQSAMDAKASGAEIHRIQVELIPEVSMKSVRVHMVLGVLNSMGTVIAASPKEDFLDADEFDLTFELVYASENPGADIEKAINKISEIKSVSSSVWELPAIANSETSKLVEVKKAVNVDLSNSPEKVGNNQISPELFKDESNIVAPVSISSTATSAPAAHTQAQTIRVDVARLDVLLNLVGELVIDRTQIQRMGAELRAHYPADDCVSQLIEATHRVARITGELQEEIMKTRMLPIDGVFQRMPRMIRDLAQKTGKDVDFQMWGGETELDRSVLEVLGDPLIHLLRNSVDHGVESPEERTAAGKPVKGIVTLSARHQENHILIEITDDGRGMVPAKLKEEAVRKGILTELAAEQMTDKDALSLIFASGFSTAASLTDISGRGVGMDIVKSNLEKIGGRVLIDSHVGKGSTFTITLPLTLAIVRALLVKAGGGTYVVPLGSVVEMLRLGKDEGELSKRSVSGHAAIVLRGRTVPLVNLGELLAGNSKATDLSHVDDEAYVVIIGFGEKQVGLCVEGLVGEQEVVIKSLGKLLGDIGGLSGATILADGSVALIIDPVRALECLKELTETLSLGTAKQISIQSDRKKSVGKDKELVR